MYLFVGTNEGVFRGVDGSDAWKSCKYSVNGKITSTDIQTLAYDEKSRMLYAGRPQYGFCPQECYDMFTRDPEYYVRTLPIVPGVTTGIDAAGSVRRRADEYE